MEWRGRFLEDFEVVAIYRSRLGRTLSETDNTWFTLLGDAPEAASLFPTTDTEWSVG